MHPTHPTNTSLGMCTGISFMWVMRQFSIIALRAQNSELKIITDVGTDVMIKGSFPSGYTQQHLSFLSAKLKRGRFGYLGDVEINPWMNIFFNRMRKFEPLCLLANTRYYPRIHIQLQAVWKKALTTYSIDIWHIKHFTVMKRLVTHAYFHFTDRQKCDYFFHLFLAVCST